MSVTNSSFVFVSLPPPGGCAGSAARVDAEGGKPRCLSRRRRRSAPRVERLLLRDRGGRPALVVVRRVHDRLRGQREDLRVHAVEQPPGVPLLEVGAPAAADEQRVASEGHAPADERDAAVRVAGRREDLRAVGVGPSGLHEARAQSPRAATHLEPVGAEGDRVTLLECDVRVGFGRLADRALEARDLPAAAGGRVRRRDARQRARPGGRKRRTS